MTASALTRRVLGLFAKEPRAGHVKTRLAADSTADWAARIAAACLRDLVERLACLDVRRFLVFTPAEARPYFADLAAGRFTLVVQQQGDLGKRLAAFVTEQLAAGAEAVVLLGMDSPTLPLAFIEQAFAELARADVVLGPATDGGYYLLGCARRVPPIFDGVPWSSAHVLAETVARLADPGWTLAVLPPWYDVDTLDDLRMLRGHLTALRKAGIDPGVPALEQVLLSAGSLV